MRELSGTLSARASIARGVGALMHVDSCTPQQALWARVQMSGEAGVTLAQAAPIVLRTLDGTAGGTDTRPPTTHHPESSPAPCPGQRVAGGR